MIESDRLLVGRSPGHPTHVFDPATDRLSALSGRSEAPPDFAAKRDEALAARRTGVYAVDVLGDARSYPNLKALLIGTLRRLADRDPDFLDRLQGERGRTRGLVARSKIDLFDKAHLAEKHAAPLDGEWWVNTNNSKDQVKRWLGVMARVAGLELGRDLRWSF
ncbi:hypothetical protein [Parvularcula dongshanensis]|uniref:Uncharacterized protein n=1 Tax=Parvularcula dongshanensis TaxID=1173995 RepID=A0A840HZS1_9PROT|nr:hypothetical protein [Parvularcula dongshanensis]MBB4658336.1 hypothetical protein [Parvularcula dongshanensis]